MTDRVFKWLPSVVLVAVIVVFNTSCLTSQEKGRLKAAEDRVTKLEKEKDDLHARVLAAGAVGDDRAAADARLKELGVELPEAKAIAKAERELARQIRAERGVVVAEWAGEGLRKVLPFIPYGEFAAPLVGLIGLVTSSLLGKKKEETNGAA